MFLPAFFPVACLALSVAFFCCLSMPLAIVLDSGFVEEKHSESEQKNRCYNLLGHISVRIHGYDKYIRLSSYTHNRMYHRDCSAVTVATRNVPYDCQIVNYMCFGE